MSLNLKIMHNDHLCLRVRSASRGLSESLKKVKSHVIRMENIELLQLFGPLACCKPVLLKTYQKHGVSKGGLLGVDLLAPAAKRPHGWMCPEMSRNQEVVQRNGKLPGSKKIIRIYLEDENSIIIQNARKY